MIGLLARCCGLAPVRRFIAGGLSLALMLGMARAQSNTAPNDPPQNGAAQNGAAQNGAAQNGGSYWFRILVPDNQVPAQIGRASFRMGSEMVLIFGANLPVEPSALQEVTQAPNASVVHLPNATILRIPLPSDQSINALPAVNSFHVVIGKLSQVQPIDPDFIHGRILFPASTANAVVTYAEPGQGVPLLIGTVTGDSALHRSLQGPGYATIPADTGIVVVAASDDLAMTTAQGGFVLKSAMTSAGLPVGNPPVSAAAVRAVVPAGGIDLPHGSIVTLRHRMEAAQLSVAAAPPLARTAASLRLARTLLSLDLGPEAHGVLTDLLRTDPATLEDPKRLALLDIADVLSYRPIDDHADWSRPFADPQQRHLWHGLADAERGDVAPAAAMLSQGVAPLIAAPSLLRRRMAPLAAETLIAGGALDAAKTLLGALPHDDGLALARAEFLQASNRPRSALQAYARMLASPDQRTAGIARYRSIMLRYQLHQIDASTAAASLGRHVYEWRGARHELNVRLAMARLLAKAGQWTRAFTGLATADHWFPQQAARIHAARQRLFNQLVASGALDHLHPLAVVSIIQNNTDLIPPGRAGVPILATLSKQLIALGLPDPAAAILQQLIARAPDDESRARMGLDLARIDFQSHRLKRAQAALDSTDAPDLSPGLAAARQALATEIGVTAGTAVISAASAASTDPQSVRLATRIAARNHDWAKVESLSQALASQSVPVSGMLDPAATRTIVRWAVAASHVKDAATLAMLRQTYRSRLPQGRDADIFNTVTAPPLTPQTSLTAALAQIKAIEQVGKAVGPASPARHGPPKAGGNSP
ncbi:hypothetical protein [Acidiphilium sp.]|uniref:hypothetical protein n=1 Tax=Acidiphilium sp. TaxID=527 RepID=UPI003D03ECC3